MPDRTPNAPLARMAPDADIALVQAIHARAEDRRANATEALGTGPGASVNGG